jgi:glycine/D-amino acid oxidase-like deaminating enzyme
VVEITTPGKATVHTADLLIIGGGIIGAYTAWLARKRHPAWHIILCEASLVGSGATHFSAALDIGSGHTPLRSELVVKSRKCLEEVKQTGLVLPVVYSHHGIGITGSDSRVQTAAQFPGYHVTEASPGTREEITTRYPGLVVQPGETMLTGFKGEWPDQNQAAAILCKSFAASQNSCLMEGTAIVSAVEEQAHWRLQTSRGQLVHAKNVIDCSGPWITSGPAAAAARDAGIRIKKIVAFHISHEASAADHVIYFFNRDAFVMPRPAENRWLFSYRCNTWDVLPDRGQLQITAADVADATSILSDVFPLMAEKLAGGRCFCDAYTESGDPVIRNVGKNNRYVLAGAASGSGYRLAPGIALSAVQLLEQP